MFLELHSSKIIIYLSTTFLYLWAKYVISSSLIQYPLIGSWSLGNRFGLEVAGLILRVFQV